MSRLLAGCFLLSLVACSSGGGPIDAGPCVPDCSGRVCGLDPVCGEACGNPCTDDSTCAPDGSRCIPPLPVGSACASAAMCGTGRLCLGEDAQAPGGYCTRPCDDATTCPAGSRCDGTSGRRICVALCGGGTDCRTVEGYACRSDGVCPACVPDCASKACGDDGCGGSCGECLEPGQSCSAGQCVNGYRGVNKSLEAPARWDVAAVTDSSGLVTLLGGRRVVVFQDGSVGTEALSSMQVFAADSLTFTSGGAQLTGGPQPGGNVDDTRPRPAANISATYDGTDIWFAGGTTDPDTIGEADGFAPKLWRQGPHVWRDQGPLPVQSRGGALLAMGGLIYFFPGETPDGFSDVARVFDPAQNAWSPLPKRPFAAGWFASATDGTRAYLLGGWDGTTTRDDVLVYDPTKGWSSAPKLPHAVAMAQAVFADERVFVFGGFDGPGTGDLRPWVQVHDVSTGRTSVVGLTYDYLARQAPARLRDGRVLLFGGFERVTSSAGVNPQGRIDIVQFVLPAR